MEKIDKSSDVLVTLKNYRCKACDFGFETESMYDDNLHLYKEARRKHGFPVE